MISVVQSLLVAEGDICDMDPILGPVFSFPYFNTFSIVVLKKLDFFGSLIPESLNNRFQCCLSGFRISCPDPVSRSDILYCYMP